MNRTEGMEQVRLGGHSMALWHALETIQRRLREEHSCNGASIIAIDRIDAAKWHLRMWTQGVCESQRIDVRLFADEMQRNLHDTRN